MVSVDGMESVLLAVLLLGFFQQAQSAASIEGVVLRAGTSTPIEGARVELRFESGSGPSTSTDLNGRFVFRNLQPGRYRLSAFRDGFVPASFGAKTQSASGAVIALESQQEVKDVIISLTPMRTLSGRIYDDRSRKPVAKAKVQALRFAYQDGNRILVPIKMDMTNDAGEYKVSSLVPGEYIVSVDPVEGSLRLYFPGVPEAAAAAVISVPPGIDYTGVDIAVRDTPAARVRGTVTSATNNEALAGVSVLLVPRRGTVATGSSERSVASSDGTFEFSHVAPGAYDVVASATSNGRLAADMPIDVGSTDVDSVFLSLQPQLTIRGQLTVENFSDQLPIRPDAVRVELRREPFTPDLLVPLPTIDATGAFTFNSVTPGEYQFRVRINGISAYVKSARFGGADALNPPFHIDSNAPMDLTLSLAPGSVEGSVLNQDQTPHPEATVVLVPDIPRRERFDLYHVTGSDAAGRFHLDSIAPGDYRLFVWDDVPADAWEDPDFIRQFESRGKPVHVSEGSRDNIQLTVN